MIRGWGVVFKIKKKQSWLQNVERAKQDLLAALKVLDAHLLTRTFLVTERVTLADIVVFCTLIHAFQVTRAPSVADVDVCVCVRRASVSVCVAARAGAGAARGAAVRESLVQHAGGAARRGRRAAAPRALRRAARAARRQEGIRLYFFFM